jgi:hypothetical protein
MMRYTKRALAVALVLGGMVLGSDMAHAGGKNDKKATPPAKPAPVHATYRPAPVTSGALGQLERLNGIGPGAGHTGVGFDGRPRVPVNTGNAFGPRSGSDVLVKPAVVVPQKKR